MALTISLAPFPASAQDTDAIKAALVRITATRQGQASQGSGFVVTRRGDAVTVLTASHVIEGAPQIEVSFLDSAESLTAGPVLGMEPGSDNGLAAFEVHGKISKRVKALALETAGSPNEGADLLAVGFPGFTRRATFVRVHLARRDGFLLVADKAIGEGTSGGVLIWKNKIAGIVTQSDESFTYAVDARVAKLALEGWGVTTNTETSPAVSPSPEEDGGPMRQMVDGFLFELDRCKPQGGNLVCTFYVTNQGGDRTLQLVSRGPRIVLGSGEEFLAKQKVLGSRSSGGTAGIEIVSGIRTRGELHFRSVPPISGKIPLLEIVCWAPTGRFSVQFRDIPR